MSNSSNYVNLANLPEIPEVAPGDYFTIKTPNGEYLIDFANLPFIPISGNNITVNDTLTSDKLNVTNSITATNVYLNSLYINNVSGKNIFGAYNTFTIDSGVITDATNTQSTYIDSLSQTTNVRLNSLSAAVPRIFSDNGVIVLDGSQTAPAFSEVIIGNNDVPANLIIQPSDINVKYLFNSQLETFLTNTTDLSSLPQIYIEENVSNNYINSNNKIQFRVVFRPGLRTNGRVTWNIIKVY